MFRKILTIVIFSVFVLCSLPFFLGLAISHTFFSQTFYTGTLLNTSYDPLMDVATKNILELDPAFKQYFSEDEIRQILTSHFTKDLFKTSIASSSSAFAQSIASVTPSTPQAEALKVRLDFTPFIEPSRLFLQDVTQLTLDRLPPCVAGSTSTIVGVFPRCAMASWQTDDFKKKFNDAFQKEYQQKVQKIVAGSGETGFVREVTVDASLHDIAFALHQFEMMDLYIFFFVFAFLSLMMLLWFRSIHTGLTLSSLMLVTASVLGLLLALILSRVVSLLPPDAIADPTVPQVTSDLARDLLSVILMSFAKVYAVIMGIVMLCSGAMYYFANRYLKKS